MIILLGENGQVAREVLKATSAAGIPCRSVSSQEGDFNDPAKISDLLSECPPGSFVINAAAYTQVDLAESDRKAAIQINGLTPGVIASVCQTRGLKLIHISTDYVFSGNQQRAYREHEPTGPLGVYGESKLLGERLILENLDQAIILRTSWVFSSHGKNFVKTMIRLGQDRDRLSVVADQIGGPTSAASIAKTCLELVAKTNSLSPTSDLWGVYHYCGKPSTTWHGFAEEIFRQTGQNVVVSPIRTDQYPTPARRPANSQLACGKLQKNFEISQPDWTIDLSRVVKELGFPTASAPDQPECLTEPSKHQKVEA
ncbi:dTDP-4-dehydrorhamnose reductase [Schlesneria paludicola]|uniref:dTDP-4-dehydrorhamnose reductase n=1 Tax=Schlesneria paludicola TaxID=360056 RepID=UPI00029A74F2|nr:dTDP-4-dehydrorhamnose reductase [Schlesneria paludicola]